MITSDALPTADDKIGGVVTALGPIQAGLGAAEMVAEVAEEARSGWKLIVEIVIVAAIVAGVAAAIRARRQRGAEPDAG